MPVPVPDTNRPVKRDEAADRRVTGRACARGVPAPTRTPTELTLRTPADEPEPSDPARAAPETAPPGNEDRPARRYLRPQIDFDEERRRAVAKVVEQRERAQAQVTFSTDDLVEAAPPVPEPIVPPADVPRDNCVIAKGKLQQLVMMMTLRCIRPPRDDMFAGIKPAYLNKRPLCREVRVTPPPRIPGVPENEIVATKCRLVDADEILAAREDLDTAR